MKKLAVVGLVAATVGLGGGMAVAGSAGDGEVIRGCYKRGNGTLRVLDGGRSCRRSEEPIQWNRSGPQGPAGRNAVTTIVVRAGSPSEISTAGTVVAFCDAGETATGGGVDTTGPGSVAATRPFQVASGASPNGWLAAVRNTGAPGSRVTATAYVLCASL